MIKFKIDWPLKNIKSNDLSARLEGERLFLSFPKLEDYQDWSLVRLKNKDFLTPFEPKWPDNNLTLEFFKRRLFIQKREMEARRGAFFFIHHRQSNKIIGGINLNHIQYGAGRYASLGYWLDKEVQGHGYMFESMGLVIDYAFNVLKLNRLNAACLPDNQKSINLLLKQSFEEEGFAKKYLQINGEWKDHKLFGLVNKNA